MLLSRLFEASPDTVVYHYCSAETLRAILESRKLRFTDMNMLNDSQEMRWGYAVFEEAATRLINRTNVPDSAPRLPVEFFDSVDEIIRRTDLIAHPFVSCFSLDGDSLEQWRAYADDGRGYAIGFGAATVHKMPLTVLMVEYEKEQQVKEMMAALVAIFKNSGDQTTTEKGVFFEECALLGAYLAGFKHRAYRHEREIRGLHAVNVQANADGIRFVDLAIEEDGKAIHSQQVHFQVRDNHLCAYLDLPFCERFDKQAISEIVLGPKNHSYPGNVRLYLGGLGYSNVVLKQSAVPYR